jgi:hypothetical protein
MFLPYAVEDNIERKKNELNVVLNESLNTINKRNGNKVSSVGIIVFHETIFEGNLVLLYKIYTVSKKCVLRVSIPTVFFCCVPRFVLKFCHISKVKILCCIIMDY